MSLLFFVYPVNKKKVPNKRWKSVKQRPKLKCCLLKSTLHFLNNMHEFFPLSLTYFVAGVSVLCFFSSLSSQNDSWGLTKMIVKIINKFLEWSGKKASTIQSTYTRIEYEFEKEKKNTHKMWCCKRIWNIHIHHLVYVNGLDSERTKKNYHQIMKNDHNDHLDTYTKLKRLMYAEVNAQKLINCFGLSGE